MTCAWTTHRLLHLGALLLPWTLAGCMGVYIYGPTSKVDAPPKPKGCGFDLIESIPERPYEELGILAPLDIEYGDMAGGPVPFKETVGERVCAAGGDAVVVERDLYGHYVRGTVLRYK